MWNLRHENGKARRPHGVFSTGASRRVLLRMKRFETDGNETRGRAGWLSTYSRTNVQKRWLTCMDGSFFSFFSPCGARPRRGLAEPAERPRRERERPQRAWSGAEGDCVAGTRSCGGRPLAGCRSYGVRQTMPPRVCGGCGHALRRRGLANGVRNATACRRVELERRLWRRDGRATLGARSLLMQPA